MEGTRVMSQLENTVVVQKFKLTKVVVLLVRDGCFTRRMQKKEKRTPPSSPNPQRTPYLHFSKWSCAMWFIPLVIVLVAQARCQRLVVCRSVYFCRLAGTWDFLWVYCGCSTCKQHGPSSLSLLPLHATPAPSPPYTHTRPPPPPDPADHLSWG